MKKYLPSLIAGSLYALSFPFHGQLNLFFLIIFSAALYFRLFLNGKYQLKEIIISTLLFVWTYNITGYYWLTFTLNEFGGLVFPFNVILWQFFSLGIAPQFYVFILIFILLRKFTPIFKNNDYKILILSTIWVLVEYYTPQQFPAHFGHPWLSLAPYLKPAQFFGTPFYSFLSVYAGMTLASMIARKQILKTHCAIISLLICFNFISGEIKELEKEDSMNVRYVQANIGNDLKLKSEGGIQLARDQVIDIFKRLSTAKSKLEGQDNVIDLILWPETAYPRYLYTKKLRDVPLELKIISQQMNADLFLGTYDLAHSKNTSFEQAYNAIIQVDSHKIKSIYHKRVLIPFGEGLPFGPLNQHLAGILQNISFFAKGENYTFFPLKNDFKAISLICYEVLFPEYVRDYLNSSTQSPSLIINLTNDSWYGPYSEQEQHLFLAKWRSVEFNLPMLRSTNTGISTYILNNGLEVQRLGNFIQDIMDVRVTLANRNATLYQKFGISMFLILVVISLAITFTFLKIPLLKDHASVKSP